MKLTNSTTWSDRFLRRMVSWCFKELGLPVRYVKRAEFRNRADSYSGRAYWPARIVCSIGLKGFPIGPDGREGMDHETFADRTEALIAITAHELAHLDQYRTKTIGVLKSRRRTEPVTRAREIKVLRTFRPLRETLLAEWSEEAASTPKAVPSVQERRADKEAGKFAEWQRKAKLAASKVKKYKRQVAYYEKALAAKRSK